MKTVMYRQLEHLEAAYHEFLVSFVYVGCFLYALKNDNVSENFPRSEYPMVVPMSPRLLRPRAAKIIAIVSS